MESISKLDGSTELVHIAHCFCTGQESESVPESVSHNVNELLEAEFLERDYWLGRWAQRCHVVRQVIADWSRQPVSIAVGVALYSPV